uniref:Uncharacterized protein n=1 Tax=Diadromus pulchellus ascovirus 4a TaxID=158683 RepID=Q9DSX3_9VIRU|nr:hypothetical protein [Diadromus pulchellus ascovirus 4a]
MGSVSEFTSQQGQRRRRYHKRAERHERVRRNNGDRDRVFQNHHLFAGDGASQTESGGDGGGGGDGARDSRKRR